MDFERSCGRIVAATGAAGCGSRPSWAVVPAPASTTSRLNVTTHVFEGIAVKTAQTRLGYADPTRLRRPEDDVGGLRLGFCLSRPGRSGRHRRALLQRKKPERPQAPNLCTTSAPIPPRGRSPQNPEAFTRGFESGCPDLRRARTRSGSGVPQRPLEASGACEVHEWTWPAARAGLDALRTRQNAICVPTQPRRLGTFSSSRGRPSVLSLGSPFGPSC